MNYIEIGYGFIFVIILHQLTDFILGACNVFVMMKNYCDDNDKRGDGVRWVDRKIILHRLYLIMMEMIAMMMIKEVIVLDG